MANKSDRYAGIKRSFKNKHLPGCECEDYPLEFSDCICTKPEREVLLSEYILDLLNEITIKEKQNVIAIGQSISDQTKSD